MVYPESPDAASLIKEFGLKGPEYHGFWDLIPC